MKNTQAVLSRTVARHRLLLACTFLLFSLSPFLAVSQSARRRVATTTPVTATSTPLSAAAAQARRDQLAKLPELLADPDPNARIANMEAILDTNDATMIQLVLRLAFQSDDANLRSLAFRAYIARLKEVTLDIHLPAKVEREYEAIQDDPHKTAELIEKYSYMSPVASSGFKLHLTFTRYNSTESTGELKAPNNLLDPFTISGDRLSVTIGWGQGMSCYLDFRPSNDMTLRGSMACNDRNFPKMGISSPIF
jgi:hypothetical protein